MPRTPKEHDIRIFIVNGHLQYIHHKPSDPGNDKPGDQVSGPTDDTVQWQAGAPFTILFDKESPFATGVGFPNPIRSTSAGAGRYRTPLLVLKDIGDSNSHSFKYTVTMNGAPPDDPDIIIDNSGGGGRRGRKQAAKKAAKKAPRKAAKKAGKKAAKKTAPRKAAKKSAKKPAKRAKRTARRK